MKLYSKTQVMAFCGVAVVCATILTGIVFSVAGKANSSKNTEVSSKEKKAELSEPKENSAESNNEYEDLSFFQQSEQQEQTALTVSSDSAFTQDELQNISVYERCSGAVVNINTQVTGVNWFLEPIVQDGGSGSGSIIDRRGYVLTNGHVVKGASRIYVSLSDGTQYQAQIVGQDTDSDLTVIKFNPPEGTVLQTIPFGNSSSLKVGQKVIAIGNPYGFDRTMTTGIVSALGRPIKNPNTQRIIRNMIQSDTAINPGNSGGPLLDTSGRMIGVNTMIYSSSGSSAGIGFAVPAETAMRVAGDLLKYGKVRRGSLSLTPVQLNNSIANYAGLDISKGLLVSRVQKGSSAEKAGVVQGSQAVRYGHNQTIIYLGGDVITAIDGISTETYADYLSALESKRPGDSVTVTLHRNGKDRTVQIVLEDPE